MSLVMAFIGAHGAVMAGDMREIITRGDEVSTKTLENELYGGTIVTDNDLKRRASDLGISLSVRDDKRKVSEQGGILVGEVSESEGSVIKKRRLYATGGGYTLAEIRNSGIQLTGSGKAGNFVVLGNEITQRVARTCIGEYSNNGTIHDAIRVIMLTMERASGATASVSAVYTLIQTPARASLSGVIERDRAH